MQILFWSGGSISYRWLFLLTCAESYLASLAVLYCLLYWEMSQSVSTCLLNISSFDSLYNLCWNRMVYTDFIIFVICMLLICCLNLRFWWFTVLLHRFHSLLFKGLFAVSVLCCGVVINSSYILPVRI